MAFYIAELVCEFSCARLMGDTETDGIMFQRQKFLDVLNGIGTVEVTLHDGRRAVEMGLATQEAATRHCVVEFSSFLSQI